MDWLAAELLMARIEQPTQPPVRRVLPVTRVEKESTRSRSMYRRGLTGVAVNVAADATTALTQALQPVSYVFRAEPFVCRRLSCTHVVRTDASRCGSSLHPPASFAPARWIRPLEPAVRATAARAHRLAAAHLRRDGRRQAFSVYETQEASTQGYQRSSASLSASLYPACSSSARTCARSRLAIRRLASCS
jgi:hypothetical protein